MARACTVCEHAECVTIEQAIRDGTSYRSIKQTWGVSLDRLSRHRAEHMAEHAEQDVRVTEQPNSATEQAEHHTEQPNRGAEQRQALEPRLDRLEALIGQLAGCYRAEHAILLPMVQRVEQHLKRGGGASIDERRYAVEVPDDPAGMTAKELLRTGTRFVKLAWRVTAKKDRSDFLNTLQQDLDGLGGGGEDWGA